MEDYDDSAATEPVIAALKVESFEEDVADGLDEGFKLVSPGGVWGVGFEGEEFGAGFGCLDRVFGCDRERGTGGGRRHGIELGGSCCDEVLACEGELVENGDVAEKFVHAVGYGVVDAGDNVSSFAVTGRVGGGYDG